jgi:hypothetical protein
MASFAVAASTSISRPLAWSITSSSVGSAGSLGSRSATTPRNSIRYLFMLRINPRGERGRKKACLERALPARVISEKLGAGGGQADQRGHEHIEQHVVDDVRDLVAEDDAEPEEDCDAETVIYRVHICSGFQQKAANGPRTTFGSREDVNA